MKSIDSEMATDIDAAQPLSEMAYQAMMGMLLSGDLALNEVVTERQIASRLGISRTPLREAIRRLEGERLLERQRTGALVVRPLPIDEFMHILSVRRLLEGESARLAAGNVAEAELKRLRKRIEEVRRMPPTTELSPQFAQSDSDLHLLIAAASGNPVLQRMIEDLRTRTAMVRFGRTPSRRGSVCDEHLAIIDALLNDDGEAARDAMQFHIDQVRKVILERLGGR